MREISNKDGTFSMVFMSCDFSRGKSNGPERIDKARLRKQTSKTHNKNADHMLNFLDIEKNRPRQFYQITLMEFNGKRVFVT